MGRDLRDVPLVVDFLDRRARPHAARESWVDVAKVALPTTLGAIAPIVGPVHSLLADLPVVELAVRLAVYPGLILFCLYVIRARDAPRAGPSLVPRPEGAPWTYRHPQRSRLGAKIGFLPLLAITLLTLRANMPRAHAGEIAGYLCREKDLTPVSRGTIQVLDVLGRPTGGPALLDDSGFFVAGLRRWSLPAKTGRIDSAGCRSPSLPLTRPNEGASLGCPGKQDADNERRHGRSPRWFVPCN